MDDFGTQLPNEYFPNLVFRRVLEEFQGPLLVEYRHSSSDETYLYSWTSEDPTTNRTRWMVFRVTTRQLASYLKRVSPFLELITAAPDGFAYLRDLDRDSSVARTAIISLLSLPEEYLPQPEAMHDEEDRPPRSEGDPEEPWTVLLNRKWNFKELNDFPTLYRKVYDGIYVFGSPSDPERDTGELSLFYQSESIDVDIAEGRGFAAKTLFNRIASRVPPDKRMRLSHLHYASPGEFGVFVDSETAATLSQAVSSFLKGNGEERYWVLHRERHRDEDEQSSLELDRLAQGLCPLVHIDWVRVQQAFPVAETRSDYILAQARYTMGLAKFLRRGMVQAY